MVKKISVGLIAFFLVLNLLLEFLQAFAPTLYYRWVIIHDARNYQKICLRLGKRYFLLPFKSGFRKSKRVSLIFCDTANPINPIGRWMREVEKECPPNASGIGVCAQDNQLLIDSKSFTDAYLEEIGETQP